ncbi:tRNA (adenosine(37)-N6)-threonylcarbamoyltransferase complex dimerization subunit type 1 TsaB [Cysteiniphilum halobium]|uniref:tRNA (adenosine(37)-N6)-threonylcarbamoyltransferase complex dimerization subunit type 1 TsaB n=1 Tax=Cysteiniphilum halobium TaxID=2219059 RepID=UPI000E65045C|nr:tRNA (adenosine(37)-N6)-threonylcarbamoyltransferase complex dimerization subunit type 1 TsaB [Cysteiniphilum halobium]
MNILAIDTSSAYCSVALFTEKQCFSLTRHIPRKHNEALLPMIDELIKQSGIDKKEIDLLAYGIGPGSFVGVRLAAAAIQAMALTLDCPVVGFSSMQAIATYSYHCYKAKHVSVILDARMSDVYFGQYIWDKNLQIMKTIQEKCLKVDECNHEIDKQNLGFIIGDVINGVDVELNAVDYCPDVGFLQAVIEYNYQQLKHDNKLQNIVQPVYLQGTSHWKKL